VDPDGRVDNSFISAREGGQKLTGYVPNNGGVVIGVIGVTIASGFDLGQQNKWDIRRIFGKGSENQDLKDLFQPYLGLQDQAALSVAGNLTVSQYQANRIDSAVFGDKNRNLASNFAKATNGVFSSLAENAQTALADFNYQNGSVPSDIMVAVSKGKYSEAPAAIRAYGASNGYAERRNLEADLLSSLVDTQ
jgi:GH24 family phage-related lysozyme (muramidase)